MNCAHTKGTVGPNEWKMLHILLQKGWVSNDKMVSLFSLQLPNWDCKAKHQFGELSTKQLLSNFGFHLSQRSFNMLKVFVNK